MKKLIFSFALLLGVGFVSDVSARGRDPFDEGVRIATMSSIAGPYFVRGPLAVTWIKLSSGTPGNFLELRQVIGSTTTDLVTSTSVAQEVYRVYSSTDIKSTPDSFGVLEAFPPGGYPIFDRGLILHANTSAFNMISVGFIRDSSVRD